MIEPRVENLDRYLACSVGPEVEEDCGIALAEARPVFDRDRLDELVRDPAVVAGPYGHDRGLTPDRPARDDGGVRALRPLPALVAVHRIVAAGHARDPVLGQLRQVVEPLA